MKKSGDSKLLKKKEKGQNFQKECSKLRLKLDAKSNDSLIDEQ